MSAPVGIQTVNGDIVIDLGEISEGTPPDVNDGWPGVRGRALFYPANGSNPYPVEYKKNRRDTAWLGPYSAPAGAPGAAGPAGALTPWVSGSSYQVNQTTLVNSSIWRALDNHTAGSSFESDALAGHWQIVNTQPVETFNPHLATSPQQVATTSSGATVVQRTLGGGIVSNFMMYCAVAGGNADISVYRNAGGHPGSPGDRVFRSPTQATAVGLMTFPVSGAMVVYPTDFLAVYCDATAPTFWAIGSLTNAAIAAMVAGETYFVNTTPPVSGSAMSSNARRGFLIVGR